MQKLTEQLVTLALHPCWEQKSALDHQILTEQLSDKERELLRKKIICFIVTPSPEEPKKQEPEEPTVPEQEPVEQPTNLKSVC